MPLEEVMNYPEYVTRDEVKRICRELGFRDWTELQSTTVLPEEARRLQEEVGQEALQISTETFQNGLEIELEHGLAFSDANVTNNHPLLTAKIVLAHLKEMLDYYERLDVAECEGDLLKAIVAGDLTKIRQKYAKLQAARVHLAQTELAFLA
jgi:hypothetical protein